MPPGQAAEQGTAATTRPATAQTAPVPKKTTASELPSTAVFDTPVHHASSLSKGSPAIGPSHAATSTIDPTVPSSQSQPTALPTNAETHPAEQRAAVKDEHPHVVGREVEKTKAEERDLKGERPEGTVIRGLEDDRLWAMLRRFDVVRLPSSRLGFATLILGCSKSRMCCTRPQAYLLLSPTFDSPRCRTCRPIRKR